MLKIDSIDLVEPIPESEHPIQPIVRIDGVLRFKQNLIVRHLLDAGPFDLNYLGRCTFSDEDRVQFAQLIGYSVSGFSELSYVDDVDMERVERSTQKQLGKNYEKIILGKDWPL